MEVMQTPTAENSLDQNVAIKQGSTVAALPLEHEVRLMLMQFILLIELLLYSQSASVNNKDLDQPLAECKGRWENRQLPKHYQDVLPEPPAALPPAPQLLTSECVLTTSPATIPASPSSDQPPNIYSPDRKLLKSTRNKFGLFQQYHAIRFPDHNPIKNIMRYDLMDASLDAFSGNLADSYHPYPNQLSFLLGEWYWNGGLKKMQSGFQDLIKIVRHPRFWPRSEEHTSELQSP